MKKYYSIAILIFFTSCKEKQEEDHRLNIWNSELSSGKQINKFFLGLKFNDHKKLHQQKIDSLIIKNKLKLIEYNDDSKSIIYEFTEIEKLKGIRFNLHSIYHNDSITEISLTTELKQFWKKNYNSYEEIFNALETEYTRKYGVSNFKENNFNKYWIKNNLEINIEISKPVISYKDREPSIHIRYQNIRKEKELLYKFKFGELIYDGINSYTKEYYNKLEQQKKPLNDI